MTWKLCCVSLRRLDRNGQKRSVVSYEILAENTYDLGQFSKLVRDRVSMNESLRRGYSG